MGYRHKEGFTLTPPVAQAQVVRIPPHGRSPENRGAAGVNPWGFTFIELVMMMAIIGTIALPGSFLMQYLVQSSVYIPRQLNMDMLASEALTIMIEGDSQAKGLRFSRNITNVLANEVSFNNQDNVLIRYRIVSNKLYRSINSGADALVPYYIPATGVTVTGESGSLFTYYDDATDGTAEVVTATPANVRRIGISLIATSGSGLSADWQGRSEQSSSIAVKKFQ